MENLESITTKNSDHFGSIKKPLRSNSIFKKARTKSTFSDHSRLLSPVGPRNNELSS